METLRAHLSRLRFAPDRNPIVHDWKHGPKMKALEAKYGKYLYLPYDIPRIEPKDPVRFKAWWTEVCKPIQKLHPDLAGGVKTDDLAFDGVNSPGSTNGFYSVNNRMDIYDEFPELKDHLDKFPFDFTPEFTLWSSRRSIKHHRDSLPIRDLPVSFRAVVYDENPGSTLYLNEHPTDDPVYNQLPATDSQVVWPGSIQVKRLAETNSFGWNNLRLLHYSTWDPRYMKILMIIRNERFNIDKFEDLMERSIAKYKDHLAISDLPKSAFVNY